MADEEIIEIDLGYSPIPDKCRRRLDEVTIKRDGHIWRIHKTDPDAFPSKPHAINIESGLKLDLSTGNLFYQNQYQKTMDRKHLLHIRCIAKERGVELPTLLV
jgi:hypothetical protein